VHYGRDRIVIGFTNLPMQSVPITNNVVTSNPVHLGCTRYTIMWSSLSVSCSRSVVFSGYSGFLHE